MNGRGLGTLLPPCSPSCHCSARPPRVSRRVHAFRRASCTAGSHAACTAAAAVAAAAGTCSLLSHLRQATKQGTLHSAVPVPSMLQCKTSVCWRCAEDYRRCNTCADGFFLTKTGTCARVSAVGKRFAAACRCRHLDACMLLCMC